MAGWLAFEERFHLLGRNTHCGKVRLTPVSGCQNLRVVYVTNYVFMVMWIRF